MNIKLQQHQAIFSQQQADKIANCLVVLAETVTADDVPYFEVFNKKRKAVSGSVAKALCCDLPNTLNSHIAFAYIQPDLSSFELLTLAAKLVQNHQPYHPKKLGIAVQGFSPEQQARIIEALLAATLARFTSMPDFKSNPKPKPSLNLIHIYGSLQKNDFRQTFAEAEGNALARFLSMLPPNKLTPSSYLRKIKKLAKENHWELNFYNTKTLRNKKAGAFLAVAQGSPEDDAGIVRLRYKKAKAALVLVGKGICYDTGGVNLKPARAMYGMHEDMQGSAVALGTFLALSRLKVNFPMECWLPLATNHIGSKAYKPNDIIVAADGTSIEIVNTDAEGRMVLADTLVMASRLKPALIIDYATLTGACVYSIGTAYSGIFTSCEELLPLLVQAGKDSGERVWPFPMDKDFDKAIVSNIADIKQCSLENGVDHILAARFLQRFVKYQTPWIHIDLASSHCKGGLAHIPTDTTGFGIRYSLNLILNKKILATLKGKKLAI